MRNLRGFVSASPRPFSATPVWALPVLLAGVLTGCPIYGDGGDRGGCESDAECPGGFVCNADGVCVDPGPDCTVDTDCGDGMICVSGACTPGSRTCRTHGDCAVGSYCDEGTNTCTPSGVCPATTCDTGFWCDYRDTCVPRTEGECRTTADCGTQELCIEGRCRGESDTCQFDRECPPGTACVNNECTGLCSDDADCLPGDSCQGGFCRTDGNECDTSATCGSFEHCVDGRCLTDCEGGGSACTTGTHCGEDQFCRPDWQPEPFCPATPCQTGRMCLEGVCRTPCTDDAHCRMLDSQLPLCRMDAASGMMLCFAENEQMPDCRVQADCAAGQDCHDGVCRNMRP